MTSNTLVNQLVHREKKNNLVTEEWMDSEVVDDGAKELY